MLGIATSVINVANNNPKTTVHASQAQNSSLNARVTIPSTVVSELIITGLNLVLPASTIASRSGACRARLLFILSIIKMALLTTIPVSEINPIINGILYGFHVTNNPIFTPSKAVMMVYRIMTDCLKLLNW